MQNYLQDFVDTLNRLSLVNRLSWHDIRGLYRRSIIGPFWLTISMGIIIACIGIIFGTIFGKPMGDYLPFLAVGLIIWAFLTDTIKESCMAFISAEALIKQLPLPLFLHVVRVIWRNVIVLSHNLLILPIVYFVMGVELKVTVLIAIPALFLVALFLSWLGLLVAMLCARYRDLPQIIGSFLLAGFYITPVIWMPELLVDRLGSNVLDFNIFYHLLEIIRAPLLGYIPNISSWVIVGTSTLFGWIFTVVMFLRLRRFIPYWL